MTTGNCSSKTYFTFGLEGHNLQSLHVFISVGPYNILWSMLDNINTVL